MTQSEKLFEQFCEENKIHFITIIPDKVTSKKHPDYRIICSGITVIVEIKEFSESPLEKLRRLQLITTGSTDTYNPLMDDRVRKKINRAMPQLKNHANNKHPAIIVLFDNVSIIPLDGLDIRIAMFGQDIVDIGLTNDPSNNVAFAYHHFGSGRKVSPNYNTTLSAIAHLTFEPDQSLHLNFYHNKYALLPLNPDWLRGEKIKHFILGDHIKDGGLRGWEEV